MCFFVKKNVTDRVAICLLAFQTELSEQVRSVSHLSHANLTDFFRKNTHRFHRKDMHRSTSSLVCFGRNFLPNLPRQVRHLAKKSIDATLFNSVTTGCCTSLYISR